MVKYEKEVGQLRTVTKVERQKKKKNRLNIYLDGKYAFSISDDIYVKFRVHKGKQLSEEAIATIIHEDHLHRAYVAAIQYLRYRMRTEAEIRRHLRKKEMKEAVIDRIVSRLYEEKLLDDLEFAESFVRDRMNRSTKGPLLIEKELKEKGVSESDIKTALEQFTHEKQVEQAKKWLEKEMKKKLNTSYKRKKEQLSAKLLQRGFSKEAAKEALNAVPFEKDESEEFLLLKNHADKLYTKYKNKYDGFELEMKLKERLYMRGFEFDQIESYVRKLLEEEL